jgi:hypothetical protein
VLYYLDENRKFKSEAAHIKIVLLFVGRRPIYDVNIFGRLKKGVNLSYIILLNRFSNVLCVLTVSADIKGYAEIKAHN